MFFTEIFFIGACLSQALINKSINLRNASSAFVTSSTEFHKILDIALIIPLLKRFFKFF